MKDMDAGLKADWFVHRYVLDQEGEKTVLRDHVTKLRVESAGRSVAAEFDCHHGPVRLLLSQQPFGSDWSSFYGGGSLGDQPYHSRILYIHDDKPHRQALLGHLSLQDDHQIRDFFIATLNQRVETPEIKRSYEFGDQERIRMPLQDCELPGTVGVSRLARHEIVIEGDEYRIEDFKPHGTGGLQFRTVLSPSHSIGGLVLPLDKQAPREQKQLLVMCFRHRHKQGSHPTDPVGDVPGHPMCTTIYGSYGAYVVD